MHPSELSIFAAMGEFQMHGVSISAHLTNYLFEIYVVVQFSPWFKFYFLLFLGMVMYDNEFETKENKI